MTDQITVADAIAALPRIAAALERLAGALEVRQVEAAYHGPRVQRIDVDMHVARAEPAPEPSPAPEMAPEPVKRGRGRPRKTEPAAAAVTGAAAPVPVTEAVTGAAAPAPAPAPVTEAAPEVEVSIATIRRRFVVIVHQHPALRDKILATLKDVGLDRLDDARPEQLAQIAVALPALERQAAAHAEAEQQRKVQPLQATLGART